MGDRVSQLARHATLRQLQVFDAIARHNSFTKAAEELYLTQPTVSIQVKKLAEVLEVALFEQIGRQVYLTPAGEELQKSVKQVLDILVNTEESIDRLKGFSGGHIKLSVISTAQYFVPKVIHDFSELYPNVSVSMQVGNRERLLERLQSNQDDFYILGQPPEGLNVESVRLAVNPLSFVANSQHSFASKSGLSLEDLKHEPFLMREKGSGIRSHIEKVFEDYGFVPNIKMVLGGNESIRLGLLQDLGISVASLPTLMEEINDKRLTVLDVKGFPINRYWYLVYPKGKVQSIAAERLVELLKAEASTLAVTKLK
ncbi:MAG: LysR family transcriptional regulator [Gammaproteobacteria bacterium]|nr:LysR family transcriptional regulator [Gammaproteobacteria bacterium]